MTLVDWDRRVARAGELESIYPAAAEMLRFYGAVASYQKQVYLLAPPDLATLATLIPEELGGAGLGLTAACAILEEINASGCSSGAAGMARWPRGSAPSSAMPASRSLRPKRTPARSS